MTLWTHRWLSPHILVENSLNWRWVRDAGGHNPQVEPVMEPGIRLSLTAPGEACGPSLLDNDESVMSFPPRPLMVNRCSLVASRRLRLWPLPLSLVGGLCVIQSSCWESQDKFSYWWHKLKRKRFYSSVIIGPLDYICWSGQMFAWQLMFWVLDCIVYACEYSWFSCPLLILSFLSTQWEWWYCPRETDVGGLVCKTFRRACSISQALPWHCLLKLIFYVYEYFVCMCVCVPDMWLVHTESRGGCWIIWSWSFI